MDDEITTFSQAAPRTRARRFDAPRFSRRAPEGDGFDPQALIEDTPETEEEGSETPVSSSLPVAPTPAAETPGPDRLLEVLRGLKWSESDIARIRVGPGQSHLTAERLFRQHAANSAEDQAKLVDAFRSAGAPQVPRDASLLDGLDPRHLLPEKPADLAQIVTQFAQLPDVQKRRFLALLDEEKIPPAGTSAGSGPSATPASPPKVGATASPSKEPVNKESGSKASVNKEPASKGDEVLSTVLKGSFDTLGTILKTLLDSSKGSTKRATKAPTDEQDSGTSADPQADEFESEETEDPSSAENDDRVELSDNTDGDENTTPYGPPSPEELQGDLGSDREPD